MSGPTTQGPLVSQFCESFLTLSGSFAGQTFVPMDWMKEALDDLFLVGPDGRRLRRTALWGVPRKNAKSTLGAAIAVYMLCVDRTDAQPQIISAASTRDQARLVFNMARGMIEASPDLSAVCEVYRNEIINTETGGVYRVVSAEAGAVHGLNPSCVIVDEYHAHKTDDLYVALNTGGRRGELLGLTWDRGTLDGDPEVHFSHTKGKHDRKVPLNPETVDVLRWVQAMTLCDGGPFVGMNKPMQRRWEKIIETAKVSDVTPHDLRRTFITRLIRAGVPLPTVQKLAGHADIKTTVWYYNQVSTGDLRSGIAKLRKEAAG